MRFEFSAWSRIDVQLVQLCANTSLARHLGQKKLDDYVYDAGLVGAEVGAGRIIHLGGFAIRFVIHILTIVTKCCRLTVVNQMVEGRLLGCVDWEV